MDDDGFISNIIISNTTKPKKSAIDKKKEKKQKLLEKKMFKDNKDPETIVKEKGLVQISDAGEIVKVCQEAIAENAKIVADYKSGKKSAIGALVGAVMKKSKGKANPQMVNKTLTELLNK